MTRKKFKRIQLLLACVILVGTIGITSGASAAAGGVVAARAGLAVADQYHDYGDDQQDRRRNRDTDDQPVPGLGGGT